MGMVSSAGRIIIANTERNRSCVTWARVHTRRHRSRMRFACAVHAFRVYATTERVCDVFLAIARQSTYKCERPIVIVLTT